MVYLSAPQHSKITSNMSQNKLDSSKLSAPQHFSAPQQSRIISAPQHSKITSNMSQNHRISTQCSTALQCSTAITHNKCSTAQQIISNSSKLLSICVPGPQPIIRTVPLIALCAMNRIFTFFDINCHFNAIQTHTLKFQDFPSKTSPSFFSIHSA
jgi:hypothetical protein